MSRFEAVDSMVSIGDAMASPVPPAASINAPNELRIPASSWSTWEPTNELELVRLATVTDNNCHAASF